MIFGWNVSIFSNFCPPFQSDCCGYRRDGSGVNYDCVIIQDATKKAAPIGAGLLLGGGDKFCGGHLGTEYLSSDDKTVCSMSVPFMVRFVSDGFEFEAEDVTGSDGFKIFYEQFKC